MRGMVMSVFAATAAFALPATPWKQAEVFAICSGRLSALAAKQNANRQPEHKATHAQMQNFDLLLEATLPVAIEHGVPPRQIGVWKSRGWVEIASLLADASYALDEGVVRRAEFALHQRIEFCRQLIL